MTVFQVDVGHIGIYIYVHVNECIDASFPKLRTFFHTSEMGCSENEHA